MNWWYSMNISGKQFAVSVNVKNADILWPCNSTTSKLSYRNTYVRKSVLTCMSVTVLFVREKKSDCTSTLTNRGMVRKTECIYTVE